MNEFKGLRKMINVKELYTDKFLPHVSGRLSNAHSMFSSKKLMRRDLPLKVTKSKSPSGGTNYSGSGMVIRTIGTPTELKKLLTPKYNKSIIFPGETRASSEFKKYTMNDPKKRNQSFLDFGVRSKKVKFSLSMFPQKAKIDIQAPKKTNKKIEFMGFIDTLSGWET